MSNRRPFDEMDRMMNRMFGSMWQDLGHNLGMDHDDERGSRYDTNLTMERAEDGYVILADLPGFEKEEIDLRYEDGVLSIEATHETTDGGEMLQFSRSRSVFEQTRVPHAEDVLVEEIEAGYHNGVLEIRIPVSEMDDDEHRIDID